MKHCYEDLQYSVEPHYNEVLGTIKITMLYQVSHYIRVKKQRNIKSWDQQNYLVITGFYYIGPLYNEVPLYNFFLSGHIEISCFVLYCFFNFLYNKISDVTNKMSRGPCYIKFPVIVQWNLIITRSLGP